jgi:pantothenate kinase
MSDVTKLASLIREKSGEALRFMVGVAGAPASGKSTLAEHLRDALLATGETAIVVPMDGFHYDDAVLNARGHRARKGAPHTYDVLGFEILLKRIKARERDIAIPVFDRTQELSRAAADIVTDEAKFIIVEGNYLLLKQAPWNRLKPIFDFTIYRSVPIEELEARLIKRWLDLGFDMDYAKNWIASNDLLNIKIVIAESSEADLVV